MDMTSWKKPGGIIMAVRILSEQVIYKNCEFRTKPPTQTERREVFFFSTDFEKILYGDLFDPYNMIK